MALLQLLAIFCSFGALFGNFQQVMALIDEFDRFWQLIAMYGRFWQLIPNYSTAIEAWRASNEGLHWNGSFEGLHSTLEMEQLL